jgi:hypothetical protein
MVDVVWVVIIIITTKMALTNEEISQRLTKKQNNVKRKTSALKEKYAIPYSNNYLQIQQHPNASYCGFVFAEGTFQITMIVICNSSLFVKSCSKEHPGVWF